MSMATQSSWLTLSCTVLGGFGHAFAPDETVELVFGESSFQIRAGARVTEEVFYIELVDLEISGPGTVAKGGGFIGGGFGVGGALEGMGTAAILNALTTRFKVHTFLTLVTHVGEVHLHHGGLEPAALRIALSEVFVTLRRMNLGWLEARRALLEGQRSSLTDSQYEKLAARLVKPPAHQPLKDRQGLCPNCEAVIPLLSESCPKCSAGFGQGSSWAVKPI